MKKIGGIHTFEDQVFLGRITKMSLAVAVAGMLVAAGWFLGVRALSSGFGVEVLPFEPAAFGGLVGMLEGAGAPRLSAKLAWLISLPVAVTLSLVVHELVHGFFFKQYAPPGAHVTFGANWKLGMLYASAENIVYTRQQYLVIAVAPSIVVTFVLVAIGIGLKWPLWTMVAATAHLSGCTGDWGYIRAIRKDLSITHCEDTSWGVAFYGNDVPTMAEMPAPSAAPVAAAAAGEAPVGKSTGKLAGGERAVEKQPSKASKGDGTEEPAAKGFSVIDGGRSS